MDFSLLDECLETKKQEREKRRLSILGDIKKRVENWQKKFHFESLILFGSVIAENQFYEISDLDFAVENLEVSRFFEFKTYLEECFKREIDLIDLSQENLDKDQSRIQNILNNGIILWAVNQN